MLRASVFFAAMAIASGQTDSAKCLSQPSPGSMAWMFKGFWTPGVDTCTICPYSLFPAWCLAYAKGGNIAAAQVPVSLGPKQIAMCDPGDNKMGCDTDTGVVIHSAVGASGIKAGGVDGAYRNNGGLLACSNCDILQPAQNPSVHSAIWPKQLYKGGSFAFYQEGVTVGSDIAGGFISSAGYLVKTPFKYSTNTLAWKGPSQWGIQQGQIEACIVPTGDGPHTVAQGGYELYGTGAGCAEKTAEAGAMKFTIMAINWGTGYEAWAADKVQFGFRQQVCVPTGTTLEAVESGGELQKINVKQKNGKTITYTFPRQYVYGKGGPDNVGAGKKCQDADITGWGSAGYPIFRCNADGHANVKIYKTDIPEGAMCNIGMLGLSAKTLGWTGFYVDYIFDMAHLKTKESWVIYDPTVDDCGGCKNTQDGVAGAGGDDDGGSDSSSVAAGLIFGLFLPIGIVIGGAFYAKQKEIGPFAPKNSAPQLSPSKEAHVPLGDIETSAE